MVKIQNFVSWKPSSGKTIQLGDKYFLPSDVESNALQDMRKRCSEILGNGKKQTFCVGPLVAKIWKWKILISLLCTEHFLYSVMNKTSKTFELQKFAKKHWNFQKYNFQFVFGGCIESCFQQKLACLVFFWSLKQIFDIYETFYVICVLPFIYISCLKTNIKSPLSYIL